MASIGIYCIARRRAGFLGVLTLGLFFAASLCPLAQIAPAQGVAAPAPAQAASPASSTASLKYDIVSVRPADPNANYRGGHTTPDETEIVLSLKALVGYAYDVRPEFVFGGPKWCDRELFDIKAKVDESDIASFESLSYQQRATMLRPILESRFGLLTGQSLLVFIQVGRSSRVSARILVRRFASRSRRRRLSAFGRERRNISSTYCVASKESMRPSMPMRRGVAEVLG